MEKKKLATVVLLFGIMSMQSCINSEARPFEVVSHQRDTPDQKEKDSLIGPVDTWNEKGNNSIEAENYSSNDSVWVINPKTGFMECRFNPRKKPRKNKTKKHASHKALSMRVFVFYFPFLPAMIRL